jgi:tRNA threonylcarbamoyladenosine biosynthesis protein TsaB
MNDRFLIIDTSHRGGLVALARGETMLGTRPFAETRRQARDLAPSARVLLAEQGWHVRDLAAVFVSLGPGSYTGLRVGLMSAKTLAYATGCTLLGVDTFAACAHQVPKEDWPVDVIADAQQEKLYARRFYSDDSGTLEIKTVTAWLETLPPNCWVTGPGLELYGNRLPVGIQQAPPETRLPSPQSILALGLERLVRGERDDPFALEPIYLRPSAAEEKLRK